MKGLSLVIHKLKQKITRKNFFQRLLLYFSTFIILLVLIIGVLFGIISERILKEQISKSSSDYLNQILYNIDGNIREINSTMINLGLNETIGIILNSNKEPIDKFSEYIDVMDILKTVKNTNKYIDSIYLYIQEDDKILTNYRSIYNAREFSDLYWMKGLQSQSGYFLDTHKIYSPELNKDVHVISMVKKLPIISSGMQLGALVINIDEKMLNSTINRERLQNNAEILIINHKGQIISSKNKQNLYKTFPWSSNIAGLPKKSGTLITTIDGVKSFIVYETSSELGWTIVSAIPYDKLFKAQRHLTKVIISISLISLLIFLILAGIASKILYRPISTLIKDKAVADESLKQIQPIAREKFVVNLLDGYYEHSRVIRNNLDTLEIDLRNSASIVLVLEVDRSPNSVDIGNEISHKLFISRLKKGISEFLERNDCSFAMGELDRCRIGIILNICDEMQQDEDGIFLLSLDLKEHLMKSSNFTITIGMGHTVTELIHVKQSYKEALRAVQQKMIFGKNNVIRIEDVEKSFDLEGIYVNEYISSIISHLRAADIQKCKETMIDAVGFAVSNGADSGKLDRFCNSLLHFIAFTLVDMGLDLKAIYKDDYDLFEDFAMNEDTDDIKKWFNDLFARLEQYIEQKKANPNYEIIEKIKEYISHHYNDELTINDMASLVHLNPSYLGKLFKKIEGITFNEFLNQVRMEKAKGLIVTTTLKVSEISEAIGMSSSQYFIYCFKNYFGITPKKFRETYFLDNNQTTGREIKNG